MFRASRHCWESPNIVLGFPTLFRVSPHCSGRPDIVPGVPTLLGVSQHCSRRPKQCFWRSNNVADVFTMCLVFFQCFWNFYPKKISRTLRKRASFYQTTPCFAIHWCKSPDPSLHRRCGSPRAAGAPAQDPHHPDPLLPTPYTPSPGEEGEQQEHLYRVPAAAWEERKTVWICRRICGPNRRGGRVACTQNVGSDAAP